ncbi:MAG: DUF1338 domain-containing protein [Candidatus Kapabacteria bacterium]|nr:DUF1338 domain-containing protein [Candidatus Kapabacteria bacterium]
MNLENIFNKLWEIYTTQNPDVQKVYNLFKSEGEEVINDHIAFRTLNDKRVNIDVLAKPFLKNGYEYINSYEFRDKHLFAKHYEHKSLKNAPRIFISELILEEFDNDFKSFLINLINRIPENSLNSEDLIFSGNLWGKPSFEKYNALREKSEYAAWFYVFGFCANHFTVSVNHLKKYDTIQKVNELLKNNGFDLNTSGGEVKGTPEELLEQSSIKSGLIEIDFVEGKHKIPGCYYEFAKRYPDATGNLYSGFIAKSADKIFESTDFYQK